MNHPSAIGNALFNLTQQRVLALLFGRPDRTFYLNEIVRLARVGKGSVMRELENLCAADLLTVSRQGNQNHYQANPASPIFDELTSIVRKTFGVTGILQTALASVLPRVERAFVYGSLAKRTEHSGSDIDLLVVGDDLSYTDLMGLLTPAEQQLGRPINPTLYTRKEFSARMKSRQNFLKQVMEQPKLWLVGGESDPGK